MFNHDMKNDGTEMKFSDLSAAERELLTALHDAKPELAGFILGKMLRERSAPAPVKRQRLEAETIEAAYLDDALDDAEQIALYTIGKLALEGHFTRQNLRGDPGLGLLLMYADTTKAVREALRYLQVGDPTARSKPNY